MFFHCAARMCFHVVIKALVRLSADKGLTHVLSVYIMFLQFRVRVLHTLYIISRIEQG